MSVSLQITKRAWHELLGTLVGEFMTYAPFQNNNTLDYEMVTETTIAEIVYNQPKPVSPLKLFFLPVKENVVHQISPSKPNLIIGCPACDLLALDLLDEIYLKEPFTDFFYQQRRENTMIIGTDCHTILEHCHCNSYGLEPVPFKNADLLLSDIGDILILKPITHKGEQLLNRLPSTIPASEEIIGELTERREFVKQQLKAQNEQLPDYSTTGKLIGDSKEEIWKRYAQTCVSCGACATICPTCTCFLLMDRSGFEKVRQMDACQYPGFARIAAGEDQLGKRYVRFRNRYLCKYVWKPEKFNAIACTGCGRCIETCIGSINKNELFRELNNIEISSDTID